MKIQFQLTWWLDVMLSPKSTLHGGMFTNLICNWLVSLCKISSSRYHQRMPFLDRAASMEDPNSPWHRQLPTVDISTLTSKQNLAYTIILNHYHQLSQNHHPLLLHMIIHVCGTAGTGKSYLINAIPQALGNACILTGTTGMASYNICGKHCTLHYNYL